MRMATVFVTNRTSEPALPAVPSSMLCDPSPSRAKTQNGLIFLCSRRRGSDLCKDGSRCTVQHTTYNLFWTKWIFDVFLLILSSIERGKMHNVRGRAGSTNQRARRPGCREWREKPSSAA